MGAYEDRLQLAQPVHQQFALLRRDAVQVNRLGTRIQHCGIHVKLFVKGDVVLVGGFGRAQAAFDLLEQALYISLDLRDALFGCLIVARDVLHRAAAEQYREKAGEENSSWKRMS